jgi:hypothetical protein
VAAQRVGGRWVWVRRQLRVQRLVKHVAHGAQHGRRARQRHVQAGWRAFELERVKQARERGAQPLVCEEARRRVSRQPRSREVGAPRATQRTRQRREVDALAGVDVPEQQAHVAARHVGEAAKQRAQLRARLAQPRQLLRRCLGARVAVGG